MNDRSEAAEVAGSSMVRSGLATNEEKNPTKRIQWPSVEHLRQDLPSFSRWMVARSDVVFGRRRPVLAAVTVNRRDTLVADNRLYIVHAL